MNRLRGVKALDNEKMLKSAISFFREMSEKNKVDVKMDMSYSDGMLAGQSIGFSIAADYLEDIFELEEK